MQSDPLHALSEVKFRLRSVTSLAHHVSARRDQVRENLSQVETEIENLSNRMEKLAKVGELFRVLLDLLVERQVRSVENVVTQGLQTVFHDQNLHFEAEVGTKYNKIAVDLFIRRDPSIESDTSLPIRDKPLSAFGGGPSSVASLTLRVLTILRLKLWPLLVLDEALAAVSDVYVEPTGIFLSALAQKMGIDILLVTHKSEFLDLAGCAYRCTEEMDDDGGHHMLLRKTK